MQRTIISTLVRPLILAPVLGMLLLAGGCQVPVNGPTEPVTFIKEGRQWTSEDTNGNQKPMPDPSTLKAGQATPLP